MTVDVSVVVPTCRRPQLLERCLAALAAQDYPAGRHEIIIVDDAPSADTEAQVACWATRCAAPLRYLAMIAPGHHGPAAARNHGWRQARGAIIAFTDDDCLPERDWLRAGVAALGGVEGGGMAESGTSMTDLGAALVGGWGHTVVPLPPEPTDYERDAAGLERAEAITANAFYRRDALASVGGFDERFGAAWREDSDLHFTLLERGGRVEPLPAAIVVHPVRPARWGISLTQQRKSRYNALLYKKHPRLYRERIQPAPPLGYYATVLAAFLALVGLVCGQRGLARGALLCWSWQTGRFCARRLRRTRRTPRHVAEMVVTSALIPPLSLYWRLRGAWEYRVLFF